MKENKQHFSKSKLLKPLTAIYFFVAFVEIIAEYYKDYFFISITKPLLMPILIGIYLCSSKKTSRIFILSLITVWMANLFFISGTIQSTNFGMLFFLLYLVLIIFMIVKMIKFPGYIPMILGGLPFLLIYVLILNTAYNEPANSFPLIIIQGLFMIFFGGICLGNYIVKANKSNTYLLLSTIFFTVMQFILIIKVFYLHINIYRPLAMLLFVCAQFLLCKFTLLEEMKKKKKSYLILNKNSQGVNTSQQNDLQHT